MSIRVRPDGTIEVDTVEEALALQARIKTAAAPAPAALPVAPAPAPPAAPPAPAEEPSDAGTHRLRKGARHVEQNRAGNWRYRFQSNGRLYIGPTRSTEAEAEADLAAAIAGAPPVRLRRRVSNTTSQAISEAVTESHARKRVERHAAIDADAAARPSEPEEDLSVYEAAVAAAPPAPAPPPPLQPAPPPAPPKPITPKKALAYRLPPGPPPRPAKKPPYCASCFKVGHLQQDCPDRPKAFGDEGAGAPVRAGSAPQESAAPAPGEPDEQDFSEFLEPAPAPPPAADAPLVHLPIVEIDLGAEDDFDPSSVPRPRNRAECRGQARPCPWVGCASHLYLNIDRKTGEIDLNYPGTEVWELPVTCIEDITDKGGVTLEEVGQILGVTRERIRQIEVKALRRVKWKIDHRHVELEDPVDQRTNAPEEAAF